MENNSLQKLQMLRPLVKAIGDNETETLYKFLYERISHPDSYVVFLGETSSGKSSIINSLIGKSLLPVKASPTTAAITEVVFSPTACANEYYAINKDATIEELDKATFLYVAEHTDDNLSRLRLTTQAPATIPSGCRIFDTPGYGSIVEKHEVVLKDFLPNSDVVVYTVDYRIGIQDSDFTFLQSLDELIPKDTKVALVVNRCPIAATLQDKKIKSIINPMRELLGGSFTKTFLVRNIPAQEGVGHPLPQCGELWAELSRYLTSDERNQQLHKAFDTYINDLFDKCETMIKERYVMAKADMECMEELRKQKTETAKRIRAAVGQLVNPAFEKMKAALPAKITKAKDFAKADVTAEIDKSSSLDKEEMVAYTNLHLIPHSIRTEMAEVTSYIDVTLTDLNRQVDDYIQKEMINFRDNVKIIIDSHVDVAMSEVAMSVIANLGRSSLEGYFVAFGGMGGANAGIANAASHLLKKAGDLFGKTFSRGTHNALKHFLSKVGATSMKAVGAAVAVVTELLFLAIDMATWKRKLRKKVGEGLDKWEGETKDSVIKDLDKLRLQNINTVNEIADKIEHSFGEMTTSNDSQKWLKIMDLCNNIKEKLKTA